jgi:hypothetical protein
MKVIILVSSIFYILGLKLSHKIDLIKTTPQVEKISIGKATTVKTENAIEYKAAEALKENNDSTKCEGVSPDQVLQ